jgi:hypothetical protein
VRITVRDNGEVIYDGTHDVPAGDTVTVHVPYVVPDHRKLHSISASASYDANPDDKGDTATVSLTGKEVVEEPFFSTSEWTLFTLIVIVLVVVLANTFVLWRRRGMVVAAPVTGLPTSTATLASMEPIGSDRIQWDDDSF